MAQAEAFFCVFYSLHSVRTLPKSNSRRHPQGPNNYAKADKHRRMFLTLLHSEQLAQLKLLRAWVGKIPTPSTLKPYDNSTITILGHNRQGPTFGLRPPLVGTNNYQSTPKMEEHSVEPALRCIMSILFGKLFAGTRA